MKTEIDNIINNFQTLITEVDNNEKLEEIRINFLGKKGLITELFNQLKNYSAEEKKMLGALINQAKESITNQIEKAKNQIEDAVLAKKLVLEKIDISEPVRIEIKGSVHPLSKTISEIKEIFYHLGFSFAEGNEVEDDFHNFTALNMPQNHPARQMQDTFYLKNSEMLLRTHTSNTQIRIMKNSQPPFKVVSLGRVFRRDSDQTHTPMFHQIEGFMVDEKVNMGNLKWVLEKFLTKFFDSNDLELRFRPSFFPFTEPSAEVDVNYKNENGVIKIGKGDKFMEILGCGMIHENVFKNCGIDPNKYQGFAFGIGVERLAMLKYGITDLRMMFENDIRFLEHYQ
jgi:phenylalanyl-tRNA synthetase alpha chain